MSVHNEDLIKDIGLIFSKLCVIEQKNKWPDPIRFNVTFPKIWNSQRDRLTEIMYFVTGILPRLEFKNAKSIQSSAFKFSYTEERMNSKYQFFSAGIDSTVLLMHLYKLKSSRVPVFVDKRGPISGPINRSSENLKEINHVIRIRHQKKTNSSKSLYAPQLRTPLFISAFTLLYHPNRTDLAIAENGPTAINPAYSASQKPTWATHPYVLKLMSALIRDVFNWDFSISLPFLNFTKPELIKSLDKTKGKNLLKYTNSCFSASRYFRKNSPNGCGVCFSCIIRKIAAACGFELYGNYKKDTLLNMKSDQKLKNINLELLISYWFRIIKNKPPNYAGFQFPIRKCNYIFPNLDIEELIRRDAKEMLYGLYQLSKTQKREKSPNIKLFNEYSHIYNVNKKDYSDFGEELQVNSDRVSQSLKKVSLFQV